MGCDIHTYIEYSFDARPLSDELYWRTFGGRINPQRDYHMFGILAGVRWREYQLYAPRGLPEDLAFITSGDAYLWITDNPNEHECTRGQAESWGNPIFTQGKAEFTMNPDWHSHSWLTPDEYAAALGTYMIKTGDVYAPEWDVMLATMRALEERGAEVRLVFWFDN
jgi:hypothetical protein